MTIISSDLEATRARMDNADVLAADLTDEAGLTKAMVELEGARILLYACVMRLSSRRQALQGRLPKKGGGYKPAAVPKR